MKNKAKGVAKRDSQTRARIKLRHEIGPKLGEGFLWEEGATVTPTFVLRLDCISPGAKCAYGVLLSFAWNDGLCWPGRARLAKEIGCTEKTAKVYIEELIEVGLVEKLRRGFRLTNIYKLPGSNIGKPNVRLPAPQNGHSMNGKNYRSGKVKNTVPDRSKITVHRKVKNTVNVFSVNESSVNVDSDERGAGAPEVHPQPELVKVLKDHFKLKVDESDSLLGEVLELDPPCTNETAARFVDWFLSKFLAGKPKSQRIYPTRRQIVQLWEQAFLNDGTDSELNPQSYYDGYAKYLSGGDQ